MRDTCKRLIESLDPLTKAIKEEWEENVEKLLQWILSLIHLLRKIAAGICYNTVCHKNLLKNTGQPIRSSV